MEYQVLVTGGAGFIGSAICDRLIQMKEVVRVRVLDNLSTGSLGNIEHLTGIDKFEFKNADIRDFEACLQATKDVDVILHQAALGSVPRSIKDPLLSNEVNCTGTLNIFTAAKENKVAKVVYASSSSVYGDNPDLPKKEEKTGNPLSPYAVTKKIAELYAGVFGSVYNTKFIGFRYFNVFGPRQSPEGAYAAVIPIFFNKMLKGEAPVINGDGSQSRDFTFVSNVVDANIMAMKCNNEGAWNQVYNIACGGSISLKVLYDKIASLTGFNKPPVFGQPRAGDIKDSMADISMATRWLRFSPAVYIDEGLRLTYEWNLKNQLGQS